MKTFSRSDVGKHREDNQDEVKLLKKDDIRLAILCDGMGGPKGGKYAAHSVIETFEKRFKTYKLSDVEKTKQWLYDVIIEANEKIFKKANTDKKYFGMGTTVVVLFLSEKFDIFASVGDSRLYTYNKENLVQISEDQTFVAALLRAGYINKEEAKDHPRKSMLLNAVGSSESIDLDVQIKEINTNKNYLICSDGVYNMVSDGELFYILLKDISVEEKVNEIVDFANYKGGIDNIGVIILERKI